LRAEIVGDRPHTRGTVRPEFDPLGKYPRLPSGREQETHGREIGSNGKARPDDSSEMVDMESLAKTFELDTI
jgi:hypothetical protein